MGEMMARSTSLGGGYGFRLIPN